MKMNPKPVPVDPSPMFPSGSMEDRDPVIQESMLGETPMGNMESNDGDNPSIGDANLGEPYMCESQKVRTPTSADPSAGKTGTF